MPPKGINNTKAFKPPSRAASNNTDSGSKTTMASKPKSKTNNAARRDSVDTSRMDTFDIDTDPEEVESDVPSELLETPRKAAPAKGKSKTTNSVSPAQSIPADLLRTLLQHHFQDKNMKVNAETSLLVGKYMDTFVREAIARAAFESGEAEGARSKGGDFLEVEDLEKLAPQLLMDF